MNPFEDLSVNIALQIKNCSLDHNTVSEFVSRCSAIINKGQFDEIFSRTEDFFQILPGILNEIIKAKQMCKIHLDECNRLMTSLNQLALWSMKESNQTLLEVLFPISNPKIGYYTNNKSVNDTLFLGNIQSFFANSNQNFEKIHSKLREKQYSNDFALIIYSFVLQYLSECANDENQSTIAFDLLVNFFDLTKELTVDDIKNVKPLQIITLIHSIDKINLNQEDPTPSEDFLLFLSLVIQSNDSSMQDTAMTYLNRYLMIKQNKEVFDKFKSSLREILINTEINIEILLKSRNLIVGCLNHNSIQPFYQKSLKYFPVHQIFFFKIILEYLSKKFIYRSIKDTFISKFEETPELLTFNLILALVLLSKSQIEQSEFKELFKTIFNLTKLNADSCIPSYFIFFEELDNTTGADPTMINELRISILWAFVKCLPLDSFDDRIFRFISNQFLKLRDITLKLQLNNSLESIKQLLITTVKKLDDYIRKQMVTEGFLYLYFTIIFFYHMKYIDGTIDNFIVSEERPKKFKYFLEGFLSLSYTQDQHLIEYGIDLFSQLFTKCTNFTASIQTLHDMTIQYIQDFKCSDNIKELFLKLIYKVLRTVERDFELIDFENSIRNHYDDKKDKIKILFRFKGSSDKSIWAFPNSKIADLVYRLSMRLNGLPEMFTITDNKYNFLNQSNDVMTLEKLQPLIVIENVNYDQKEYHSASDALARIKFTKTLLDLMSTTKSQSLQKISYKILSYLPSDYEILDYDVDAFLKAVNNAKNDYVLDYLFHCACHFTIEKRAAISSKLNQIWPKIQEKRFDLAPLFDFIFCIFTDSIPTDYIMFISGRIFKAFLLHEKKSYRSAMKLYKSTLFNYLDINDNFLLCDTMLLKCTEAEWPYLKEIYLTLYNKMPLYEYIVNKVTSEKKQYRYMHKMLRYIVMDIRAFINNVDKYLNWYDELPSCTPEQFDDIVSFIQPLFTFEKDAKQEECLLKKLLDNAFLKGYLDAGATALDIYVSNLVDSQTSQAAKNILMKYLKNHFNVFNYKSEDHVQNKFGYVGLMNLTSTCYMNCLFQVLNQMPEFLVELFKSDDEKLDNFKWIMASLQFSKRDIINPRKFIEEWTGGWNSKPVDPLQQQDVVEFFMFLLEDFPKAAQKLFQGEYTIRRRGKEFETATNELFQVMVAEVTGHSNLKDSLFAQIEPEILLNYEIKPGVKQSVQQETKIKINPKILAIQINRKGFDQQNNPITINDRFEFPEILNLSYLMEDHRNCYYKLHSIVCHRESVPNHGHYYSIVRNKSKEVLNDQKDRGYLTTDKSRGWVKIDDCKITELINGYEEAFGGRVKSNESLENGQAALLFYILDETPMKEDTTTIKPSNIVITDQSKAAELINQEFNQNRVDVEYQEFDNKYNVSETLLNVIRKENENFSIQQMLFSPSLAEFLTNWNDSDVIVYYLFNILMHGSDELSSYFNDIVKNLDREIAGKYVTKNFDDFYGIYKNITCKPLLENFYQLSKELMETAYGNEIMHLILDNLEILKTRNINYLFGIIDAYFQLIPVFEGAVDVLIKLIGLFQTYYPNKDLDLTNLFSAISALLQSFYEKLEAFESIDIQFFRDNYESLRDNGNYHDKFLLLIEHFVKLDLIEIEYLFKFGNLTVDDYTNALNETNYMLIAERTDKMDDILNNVIKIEWPKEKIEQFSQSVFEDGMFDKKKQNIFFYFLNQDYYETSMILQKYESAQSHDLTLLNKLLKYRNMQNDQTLEYLMQKIENVNDENEIVELIKLMRFLVNFVDVEKLFNSIFKGVPDDETIILNRFEAFLVAVEYKKTFSSLLVNQLFLKYQPIFEKSPSYQKKFNDP